MPLNGVWGGAVAWDLFLAGTGAGAFLMGAVVGGTRRRDSGLLTAGTVLGPVLVALGALLLLIDLGHPAAVLNAYVRPFRSVMSAGVWVITLFIVDAALLLLDRLLGGRLLSWSAQPLRLLGYLFALGVLLYPGFLLGVAIARPLWSNGALPIVLLISGLLSGLACDILLLMVGLNRSAAFITASEGDLTSVQASYTRWTGALLALEALSLLALFSSTASKGAAGSAAAEFLLTGSFALPFWGGAVGLGLLVPAAFLSLQQRPRNALRSSWVTWSALLVVIGSVFLRYAILAGGATMPTV